MNPIRRELLNGLLVLVVASLLSVAFSAFQVSFNAQLWVLILIGLAIALTGYVVFEVAIGHMASAEHRENEWLMRVGKPRDSNWAWGHCGHCGRCDAGRRREGDETRQRSYDHASSGPGGKPKASYSRAEEQVFVAIMEQMRRGTIREYKRIHMF